MILSFHPCFEADAQITIADRDLSGGDLDLIRRARAILLPQSCPRGLYEACRESAAFLFPNYDARFEYPGKIDQIRLFRNLGCPHPKTWTWPSVAAFEAQREKEPGAFSSAWPFFVKTDRDHEADGVYLVTDERSLESVLAHLRRQEVVRHSGFLTQEMISAEGHALRAVVLGRKTITYWKRPPRKGSQAITTISRGARIDREWRPDLQEKAAGHTQRLAAATGIDLAAVDLVFSLTHPDPEPLFLEINYYFGRRGLGGTLTFYRHLLKTIRAWLVEHGLDPGAARLV
jgi:ribosomal protein S6--L-glutamate ligase